jgi:D-amino-acid dehydrogenase
VASLRLHAELAREGLDTGFTRQGAVNVYTTERAFEAGRREAADQAERGIKSEVLDPVEARELEPALADGLAGAVYYPEEAHCIPRSFMVAVAAAAAEAGATIRTGVEVRRLDLRDGRVESVETTDGPLHPGTVVLANGAWASRLARHLGVTLPVEGGKGYHLDLSGDGADPRIPVYMQEFRVIATPMGRILRLAGTLQLTGLSTRIDRVRVRAILEAGARVLRGVGRERVVEVWGGIRPCPPDGLPIIGRSRRVDNVIFATGHAMKGLHLAPVTGKLVADLLEGKEPSFDLGPLSPDRFARDRGESVKHMI